MCMQAACTLTNTLSGRVLKESVDLREAVVSLAMQEVHRCLQQVHLTTHTHTTLQVDGGRATYM